MFTNKIKKWLLNNFLKKEISEIRSEYELEVEMVRCDYDDKIRIIEVLRNALSGGKQCVVGMEKNKIDEDVLVVCKCQH